MLEQPGAVEGIRSVGGKKIRKGKKQVEGGRNIVLT